MSDQAAPETVRTHRWEIAGLGRAPFRYLGMYENRYDMGFGQSKPGGTCTYCGQGILYCFKVESSDGRKFVVGCDCIAHCHDPAEAIVVKAKRALKNHKAAAVRAKKTESRAAAKAARQAQWDAEAAVQREAVKTDPLYLALGAHAANSEFIASLRTQMERRPLSPAQEVAAREALARIAARAAVAGKSRRVGQVGERVTIVGTVEFSTRIYAGMNRHYDPDRYLTKIRTDDLALIVWFGAYSMKKGQRVSGKATVKEHSEYQGEAQTVVKNPRWKEAA